MKKLILFLALAVSLLAQKQVVKNSDGTVTLDGATISTIATIPMAANAGPLTVTNKYSSSTNGDDATLTPSAVGTAGQTISVKLINNDATNATKWTINNGGTDYEIYVPASSFIWWTLVSNATDWIPTTTEPADGTAAATSLVHMRNPTSGVDFTEPLSTSVSTALTATPVTVAQGGTGVATLTGIVKGSGTSNFSAAARSDYVTVSLFGGATFAAPDTDTTETDIVAADCYGLTLYYSPTTSGTITLPAGAAGMSILIMSANTSACEIIIDCDAGDDFVLAGTDQADGVSIKISAAAKGDYIGLTFDGTSWVTWGSRGTWIAGS